jgi:hypothetical protein
MMTSFQEEFQCLTWFAMFKGIAAVHSNFRRTNGTEPASAKFIRYRFVELKDMGSAKEQKSPGRSRTSEEVTERKIWYLGRGGGVCSVRAPRIALDG